MKRKISKNNCIFYLNRSGLEHSEANKPSVIRFDGNISFCKNNKFYRQGKPSIINPDVILEYYEDNKLVKKNIHKNHYEKKNI